MAPLANLKMLSKIKNVESNPVVLISEKQRFFKNFNILWYMSNAVPSTYGFSTLL